MDIDWYKEIIDFYSSNRWDKNNVKVAVVKEKITEEQYKEIVGEDYIATN